MTTSFYPSSYDDERVRPIECYKLISILQNLYKKQLLGRMELSTEGEIHGVVDLAPVLAVKLIARVAALSGEEAFPSVTLCFTEDMMTLTVRGINRSTEKELAELARLAKLAGFKSDCWRCTLELTARVHASGVLTVYAFSPTWLEDIFARHFPKDAQYRRDSRPPKKSAPAPSPPTPSENVPLSDSMRELLSHY